MNFQQGLARTRTPAFESYWKTAMVPKPSVESISDSYILATLQYASTTDFESESYESSGEPFINPSWKDVPKAIHDSPPLFMPDERADRDEVRRFLYMILTYRKCEAFTGTPLAITHPIAIVSAIERWHHGGHALNVVTGPDWFTDSFLHRPAADIRTIVAKILWASVSRFLMKKSGWMVYPWLRNPKVKAEGHLVRAFSRRQHRQPLSERNRKHLKEVKNRVLERETSKGHERERSKQRETENCSEDDQGERKDSMQPSKRSRPAIFSSFSKLRTSEYVFQREKVQSLPDRALDGVDISNAGYPYRYVTSFEVGENKNAIFPAMSHTAAPAKLVSFEQMVRYMLNLRLGNREKSRPRQQEQLNIPTYVSVPSMRSDQGDGMEGAKSTLNSGIHDSRHQRQHKCTTSNPITSIRNAFHKIARKRILSVPSTKYIEQLSDGVERPHAANVRPKESFWNKRRAFALPDIFRKRG
jgi:hypothetical protein